MKNFVCLATMMRRTAAVLSDSRTYRAAAMTAVVVMSTSPSYALNPSLAPGQNFNLSNFELQLPFAASGSSSPETITQPQLQTYQDPGHKYFFTESGDGAMVMKEYGAPPNCVTTANSEHCRTELHELGSWSPTASTNRMNATLTVTEIDNGSVVVGQIHILDSISTKPAMELYYESNGDLKVGVESDTSEGASQGTPTTVGHVPVGTQFTYEIDYENGQLSVSINGSKTNLSQKNLNNPSSYFKAGCYNQGTGTADVHFLALTITH
jgi:hypothetical protein